jgi:protein-tyrosine phosphatase
LNPKLYWIPSSSPGKIAISARPRGGDWLEDEVEGWRKQDIQVVVSLLTPAEDKEFELKSESVVVKAKGIQFISSPVEDRGVPQSSVKFEDLVAKLAADIQHGRNIAVHCRQGIGRSSLLSAAVLVFQGEELDEALAAISGARAVSVPETEAQRAWLERFARAHRPMVPRS